jgi:hypothetical protein
MREGVSLFSGRDSNRGFLAYVGDPHLHDASVLRVVEFRDVVDVLVKSETGDVLTITFSGVESMKSNRPEGMMIYALAEIKTEDLFASSLSSIGTKRMTLLLKLRRQIFA